MFSRLELDCRYKAQLTGHPIGPPIECQSCANPVRSVQRTAHAVHCTPRNRATILLQLLPIAVSVSIRSQSCYNLGRLWLDCIISVRNPATIVHQSCTNAQRTAHVGGRVSGFFVEIPGASNRASILHNRIKCFLNWSSIVNKNELQLGNKRKAYGTPNRTCNRVTILHRSRAQCIVHFSGKSPVLKIEPQSCTNLENFVWIGAWL